MPSVSQYTFTIFFILVSSVLSRFAFAELFPADLELKKLDNQLVAAVLSRPTQESAIVAIQFNVGSFHDEISGQAHLAEHLFLRSHFGPSENQGGRIRDFMSVHSGRQDGKTSYENTRFYFEFTADVLDSFLQNLAQIIANPDFGLPELQSEISAINNEFSLIETKQFWRLHDALKSATAPLHPFRQFKSGNLATFAQHRPEQLLASARRFLDDYYHSGNMTVLVVAPFSSKKTSSIIDATLGKLSVGDKRPKSVAALFDAAHLPLQLRIAEPVASPQLNLLIPMNGVPGKHADEIIDYLKFWSGATGPGSWQQQLTASGLTNRVILGPGISAGNTRTLSITLSLTDLGARSVPELTAITMDALQSLSREANASSLQAAFSRRRLELSPKPLVVDQAYAQRLLRSLADRSPATSAAPGDFSHPFESRNVLAIVVGDDVATDQLSPVFGVPHSVSPLTLYPVNESAKLSNFAPPDFEPIARPAGLAKSASLPRRLMQTPVLTTWHSAAESENGTVFVKLSFNLPSANESLESRALWSVWYEDLRRFAEHDNSSRWYRHANGAGIELHGGIDQVNAKLEMLSARLRRPLSTTDFSILKQSLIADWQTAPSYHFAFEVLVNKLKQLILPGTDDSDSKSSALKSLSVKQLTAMQARSLQTMHTTLFLYGATEQQARHLAGSFDVYGTEEISTPPPLTDGTRNLDSGYTDTLKVTMPGDESALLRYHQLPHSAPEDDAKFRLLLPLIKRQYFSSIREQQRLAYGVNVVPVSLSERRGIAFIAQSAITQPDKLHLATQDFLREFPRWLDALPPENFQQLKASVSRELQGTPRNGKELADHYWAQIAHGRVNTHWDQSVLKALDEIDVQELSRYYHSAFDTQSQSAIILEGWQRAPRQRDGS